MRYAFADYAQTPAGYKDEKRDCVVRALRVAAGISYEEAHATLKSEGRFDRGTTFPSAMARAAVRHGFVAVLPDFVRPTLAHFVRTHPTGSYIVRLKKHAIAVRDGIVHDWKDHKRCGPRTQVRGAWGRAA